MRLGRDLAWAFVVALVVAVLVAAAGADLLRILVGFLGAFVTIAVVLTYLEHRRTARPQPHSDEGTVPQVLVSGRTFDVPQPSRPLVHTSPRPTNLQDYSELDPAQIFAIWTHLTSAQQSNFLTTSLHDKWVSVSAAVEDVGGDPPSVRFHQSGPNGLTTWINFRLVFRPEDRLSLLLLKAGDMITARGRVDRLDRNPYGVPIIVIEECELVRRD
jgi:hypothetical protein